MDAPPTKNDGPGPEGRRDPLAKLAVEACAGDTRALEQLLLALLPRTRNLVRYLIGGDPDVDDIAQTALWAIARKLGTFEGRGVLTAWTDRIVARAAFAELRRRATRPRTAADAHLDSVPSETTVGADYLARRWVARLLDQLPAEQREAVVMHHVMDLTIPEVAAEMSVAVETVRSRLRLAKARLRDLGAQFVVDSDDAPPITETDHES
jgi:RNA polymerase sigma-70 factor (ECF subfamily)